MTGSTGAQVPRAKGRRWRRLLGLLTVAAGIAVSAVAAEVHGTASSVDIGSGAPGLKLCHDASGESVIFEDEPWTVGGGMVGGWNRRHLVIVAPQLERLPCANLMGGYQLYPFDRNWTPTGRTPRTAIGNLICSLFRWCPGQLPRNRDLQSCRDRRSILSRGKQATVNKRFQASLIKPPVSRGLRQSYVANSTIDRPVDIPQTVGVGPAIDRKRHDAAAKAERSQSGIPGGLSSRRRYSLRSRP